MASEETAYKIGVCGAQGTGKSTLAKKIVSDHKLLPLEPFQLPNWTIQPTKSKNIVLLTEVARNCPFPVLTKDTEPTEKAQLWILAEQMKLELELSNLFDVVISDRTVLDIYVYSKMFGIGIVEFDLYQFIMTWMSTYDVIYFLRPDIPLVSDNFRSTDKDLQMEVDWEMEYWLDKWDIKYTEIRRDGQCKM